MKLFKIFSVILALTLCVQPAWGDNSAKDDPISVSEQVHHANVDTLKDYIIKFHARGGAYIVLNTTTDKLADKQFIEMPEGFEMWSNNATRLFDYAVGMHTGIIKDDEKIIFNIGGIDLSKRIAKDDREAYLQPFYDNEHIAPMKLLSAYIRLFKNSGGYLSETQLARLKSAVSENVKSGKAKRAKVEEYNVSGIASTTRKSDENYEVYTLFVGEFEANGQNYALITVLDEPQPHKETYGFTTSGWNAVPLAAEIIKNIGKKQ